MQVRPSGKEPDTLQTTERAAFVGHRPALGIYSHHHFHFVFPILLLQCRSVLGLGCIQLLIISQRRFGQLLSPRIMGLLSSP